jgi:hypothetical protein
MKRRAHIGLLGATIALGLCFNLSATGGANEKEFYAMPFSTKDPGAGQAQKDRRDKTRGGGLSGPSGGGNGDTAADVIGGMDTQSRNLNALDKISKSLSQGKPNTTPGDPNDFNKQFDGNGIGAAEQNPGNLPTVPSRNRAPVFSDPTLGDVVGGMPATNPLGAAIDIAANLNNNSLADQLGLSRSVPDAYGDGTQDVLGGGAQDTNEEQRIKANQAALLAEKADQLAQVGPGFNDASWAEYTGPNLQDSQRPYGSEDYSGDPIFGQTDSELVSMLSKPLAKYRPKIKSLLTNY